MIIQKCWLMNDKNDKNDKKFLIAQKDKEGKMPFMHRDCESVH